MKALKAMMMAMASVVIAGMLLMTLGWDKQRRDAYATEVHMHEVVCNGQVYEIPIYSDIRDLDGYSKGYCDSIR